MAIFPGVQAGMALAVALAGGVAVVLLAWALRRRGRVGSPGPAELAALGEALGLLSTVVDRDGRVLRAPRGLGLAPGIAAASVLGDELAVLRRGARPGLRGAVAGRIAVPGRGTAQAMVIRVGRRPVRDLVLLRPDWEEPRPPPLPGAARQAPAPAADGAAPMAGIGPAAGRSVLAPAERALTAAALLRLALPQGGAAVRELDRLDRELAQVARRARALSGPDARRAAPVDLRALMAGVVEGLPRGVRLDPGDPAPSRADPRRAHAALREVVAAALGPGPEGVRVAVRDAPEGPEVEVAAAPDLAEEAAAVAAALLGPEGAVVALGPGQGNGVARRRACRIRFPAAVRAPGATTPGRGEPVEPRAGDGAAQRL